MRNDVPAAFSARSPAIALKRRWGLLIERLTNVAFHERIDGRTATGPDPAVQAELTALRARVPGLTGTVVASSDGLLIAHDLPPAIEPSGMAALTAAELSLSHRMASTAHGGGFQRWSSTGPAVTSSSTRPDGAPR